MKYTGIDSIDEKITRKIEAAKRRKYFVPREENEYKSLIPHLATVVSDFRSIAEPLMETDKYGQLGVSDVVKQVAMDIAWKDAYRATNAIARDDVWNAMGISIWKFIFDASSRRAARVAAIVGEETAVRVATDVCCEVMSDQKGYERNPFEKIVEMYDMGFLPIDLCLVDGKKTFLVDMPLKDHKLGLWAEGDSEILYKHAWTEHFMDAKPIKPVQTKRVISFL